MKLLAAFTLFFISLTAAEVTFPLVYNWSKRNKEACNNYIS